MRIVILHGIFLTNFISADLPPFIKNELKNSRAVPVAFMSPIAIRMVGFFVTPADVAKMATKFIINQQIPYKKWLCWPVTFTSHGFVDYGCEAVWAGARRGIRWIPHELAKYCCAEFVYYQLCKGATRAGLEYPESIKGWRYIPIRLLIPFIARWAVGLSIEQAVETLLFKKTENPPEEFGAECEFLT